MLCRKWPGFKTQRVPRRNRGVGEALKEAGDWAAAFYMALKYQNNCQSDKAVPSKVRRHKAISSKKDSEAPGNGARRRTVEHRVLDNARSSAFPSRHSRVQNGEKGRPAWRLRRIDVCKVVSAGFSGHPCKPPEPLYDRGPGKCMHYLCRQ